ncbi:hypothetical protein [Rhizobium leguminosarum]|uniref:hypothetical protein n=1 Tax=Rhizobium leguminosarum TaxID=384 RepID=UPI001C94742D|nr:hypothetical protein [Rhizobium leguminosarum]MBY5754931.1 hypothetical protein [Rhizobium leguminosarum]
MITTPLENSALWQPIEHWQHRACVSTLIKSMTDEGYKAKSICSTTRIIGAFIQWTNDRNNGNPTQLIFDDIDGFISGLAAGGMLRYGERRALRALGKWFCIVSGSG